MKESIEMEARFPVSARELYYAWMSPEGHSAFTGGVAEIRHETGSKYSAWDGYIQGKILELEPEKRILHTWRSSEFPEAAEDSQLEILLEDEGEGCILRLKHWDIPEGQGDRYRAGWEEHYFTPMRAHFGDSKN